MAMSNSGSVTRGQYAPFEMLITRKVDVANHAENVNKAMPPYVNFQQKHHLKVTKRECKKGVSGIKHFCCINSICLHYIS